MLQSWNLTDILVSEINIFAEISGAFRQNGVWGTSVCFEHIYSVMHDYKYSSQISYLCPPYKSCYNCFYFEQNNTLCLKY